MARWAILGTGFISQTVAQAIQSHPGSELLTIAGRNADRVAEFQAKFDIPKISIGYEDALADPEVDIVYIGLPNHVHHELTAMAAAAGKPVLSEKSLTTTMDQAAELVAAVRKAETFFVEGFMYLSHPFYQRVVEVLKDGRLGRLRSIHGFYSAAISGVTNPLGRGTLYNLGCYPASLAHLVVQTMEGEDAFGTARLSGFGVTEPDHGTVVDAAVTAKVGDVLVNLHSTDSYGMAHEFVIAGENGTLKFLTNPWRPNAGDNRLLWQPYKGEGEEIVVNSGHDDFYHQVAMVEANVAAGNREATRPSPRLKDSLEIMEFLTQWEALCLKG